VISDLGKGNKKIRLEHLVMPEKKCVLKNHRDVSKVYRSQLSWGPVDNISDNFNNHKE
jgi:hypothetical protein